MTKVLMILNELMPSGSEAMLYSAAKDFREMGIQAEILATGEQEGPFAGSLREVGFTIHSIPYSKSISFYSSVRNLIRSEKYDLVHVFSERSFLFYALVALLEGRRTVRTINAIFRHRGLLALRQKLFRLLFRGLGGMMVSISPSMQLHERKRFWNPTCVVPNWYDSNRFQPPTVDERKSARKKFGLNAKAIAVVSVGNCHEVKNHTELLKALSLLKNEIPFVYLHVGMEEPEQPERALAKELGIADRVHFLGYTRDILPALHACDVYVMPSLREGFGVAAVEALSTGVPSVFARVQGLRDFEGFESIHYADKPVAEDFAAAIRSAAGVTAQQRKMISSKVHKEVEQRYGIRTGLLEYAQIYRELVQKKTD